MGKAQQVYTAVVCSLATFLAGTTMAWPSYTISYDTFNKFSSQEVEDSLLDSMPCFGVLLGLITIGYVMEKLGRKCGGVAIAMGFLVSWSIVNKEPSKTWSILAKTLSGAASGSSMMYTTVFISEIAFNVNRGLIISLPLIFFSQGVLVMYLLNVFLTYRVIAWIFLSISVMFAILIITTVESPVYFIKKNKKQEALSSISYYKTYTDDTTSKTVLREYCRLKRTSVPHDRQLELNEDPYDFIEHEIDDFDNRHLKSIALRKIFVSVSSCRMFVTLGAVMALQMLSGILVIQLHFEDLLLPDVLSTNSCAIVLSLAMAVAYTISGLIVDKIGEKTLLLLSSILLTISLLSLGISIQYSYSNVTMLLMSAHCFGYGLGALVPWLLITDRFAPEVQPFTAVALHAWMWFVDYSTIATVPVIQSTIGLSGTVYAFSIFGAVFIFFTYFFVPETKDKCRL